MMFCVNECMVIVCVCDGGHGALHEDRAHDPEQGQPCADGATPRTGRKVAI